MHIREVGPDRYWQQHTRRGRILTWVGALVTYLAVVRVIRFPLIRQLVGIQAGLLSRGIWAALCGVVVTILLGWRSGGDDGTRPE